MSDKQPLSSAAPSLHVNLLKVYWNDVGSPVWRRRAHRRFKRTFHCGFVLRAEMREQDSNRDDCDP